MKGGTICALCTAEGRGAISLIRVSGPRALTISRKIAHFLPSKPESHRAYFGILKKKQKPLDQALVTYFAKGRSFTGEESLEISCHGGAVWTEVLKALIDSGARPAEPGEFSLRAFSNGKMDLVQAEALLQFIESQSQASRRQAFFQLEGLLSKKLRLLEKKWLFLLSHLEADIDFSMEGLSLMNEKQIKEKLEELEQEIKNLLSKYQPFENLQKGLVFGIFGSVNVGKSSLFNALLDEDKAIVSKEEGTTRDIIEGQLLNPQGLNINLKDGAGFRISQSEGELKGQKKVRDLFFSCDYKMVLIDSSNIKIEKEAEFLFTEPSKTLIVLTKKDLAKKEATAQELLRGLKKTGRYFPPAHQAFFVSSLTKEGISRLRKKILSLGKLPSEGFLISNFRHHKGLKIMEKSIENSFQLLNSAQREKDLMALELRQGLQALYEILGQQIDDQILDRIFKDFCIGK